MPSRRVAATLSAALAAGAALLAPGRALAGDGGAPPSVARPIPPLTGATGADGVALTARSVAMLGGSVRVQGAAGPQRSGGGIVLQAYDPVRGWTPVLTTTAAPDGSFRARWRATRPGPLAIRAVPAQDAALPGGGTAQAPIVGVMVYRPARATVYGPGFYGRRTACGVRLTHATAGVASPSLPCGTIVAIQYAGLLLTAPVIDRGPFANHATWDLTEAAARSLAMVGTATVGTLVVGPG